MRNEAEYIKELEFKTESLEKQVALLLEQLTLSRHKKYSNSSEKSEYNQINFFNEAEVANESSNSFEEIKEIKSYTRKKKC